MHTAKPLENPPFESSPAACERAALNLVDSGRVRVPASAPAKLLMTHDDLHQLSTLAMICEEARRGYELVMGAPCPGWTEGSITAALGLGQMESDTLTFRVLADRNRSFEVAFFPDGRRVSLELRGQTLGVAINLIFSDVISHLRMFLSRP